MKLTYFFNSDGDAPFEEWFLGLDPIAASKVTTALVRLELGHTSSLKGIGGGVSEYRIDWGPGYRIYFGRDGDELIILLCGGTKRRQSADISRAQVLWAEYKRIKSNRRQ